MKAGHGEPSCFSGALGQGSPLGRVSGICLTGVCVAQLFREAAPRQNGMQSPSGTGAQEAGIVSRRAEEPSDTDTDLIPGNMERKEVGRADKRRQWKELGTTGSSEEVSGCGCRAPGWRGFTREPQGNRNSPVPEHSLLYSRTWVLHSLMHQHCCSS